MAHRIASLGILALILSSCAVGYQSSGSRQYGWTIGPAQLHNSEHQSHMGWCIEPEIVIEPYDETHRN